jgi:hypothetical protein
MFRVTALAAAVGLGALQMSAQQGTFNLPVAAHWGNAVLQPGEHSVRIPIAPSGQKLVYLLSDRNTQMTVPLSSEPLTQSGRSYLHLVKINGTYYVDAYQSEINGAKFFFPKPKANRTAGPIAEEESTIISVASN